MNKKIILGLLLIILVSAVFYLSVLREKVEAPSIANENTFDIKNTAYNIEGVLVTLKNGVSEVPSAPGSASKTITRYFGNEAKADLNTDGKEDIVLLLTQESGGSGLIYYVVALLKTREGYKATNAVFLGDRIAPQTTEIHDGKLYVNFAERKPDEPMTTNPSVGTTKIFKVTEDGQLTNL